MLHKDVQQPQKEGKKQISLEISSTAESDHILPGKYAQRLQTNAHSHGPTILSQMCMM